MLYQHQRLTVLTSLRQIFGLSPGSSYLSLIVGTPSTGRPIKSLFSLDYFSITPRRVTSFPTPSPTVLRINDSDSTTHLFYYNDEDGVQILTTCSSNDVRDDIVKNLKQGIPDSANIRPNFPAVVQIAHQWYDYGNLDDVSLNRLAVKYENEIFHVDQRGTRKHPSKKGLQQVASKSIVFSPLAELWEGTFCKI